MKRKLLLASAVLCAMFAKAQNYYYLQSSTTTTDYNMLNLGTVILPSASNDVLSGAQNIPFAFNFYGAAVTQYKVSDNGYLTFDVNESVSSSSNVALPSATAPKNAIFPFWDATEMKMAGSVKAEIRNWTYGSAPNRVHVIQWFTASKEGAAAGSTNYLYYAIRLWETGDFDIVYNDGSPSNSAYTATMGCQNANGTVAKMIGAAGASSDFPNKVGSSNNNNDKVYKFVYGTQAGYDLSVTKLTTPAYAALNVATVISGTITNLGANAITSFKLNYSVDGGATVSKVINGVNIASDGGSYNFAHATAYTPTALGAKSVKVWATELNVTHADAVTTNDDKTATITVIEKMGHRMLLHEVFSSSTCGPCAPGNVNMTNILNTKSVNDYTVIKYQQDFPGTGDPYCITEAVTRRGNYSINSIPRLEIDGGWDGNGSSYTSALYDQYQGKPAIMDIYATYTVTGQTVKVDVMLKPYADFPTATKLYIAILEKNTYQNKKSNGETEFHHVMKKMLPGVGGTTVAAMTAGSTKTFTQTYTFPGVFRLPADGQSANRINTAIEHSVEEFTDLEVVVFLQNSGTKEVYNSCWGILNGNLYAPQPENVNVVNVYPNPANDKLLVDYNLLNNEEVNVTVLDIAGREVLVQNEGTVPAGNQKTILDIAALNPGVYFVTVKGNNGFTSTQKFVISR